MYIHSIHIKKKQTKPKASESTLQSYLEFAISNILQRVDEFSLFMQCIYAVAAAHAFALDQHVRYRATASDLSKQCLQIRAERVLVQLDNVRGGGNTVLLGQEQLGPAAVGAT